MANEQEPGAKEMDILLSLVDDENITPEQAVQQIIAITEATKSQENDLGNHCYFTASAVLYVASSNAPDKHSKLLAFIHELRSKTVTDSSTGEALLHDTVVVWKDLPTFGYTIADELNSIPGKIPTQHVFEATTLTSSRLTIHIRKGKEVGEHYSILRTTRCQHPGPATRLYSLLCTLVHKKRACRSGSQI
jgi:hypothetical protein